MSNKIRIPMPLAPNGPDFSVTNAEYIEYTGTKASARSGDTATQKLSDVLAELQVKTSELDTTINAEPEFDFGEGKKELVYTTTVSNLPKQVSLPIRISTRAPGYCTIIIERTNNLDYNLSNLTNLHEALIDKRVEWLTTYTDTRMPGSFSVIAETATTVGDYIYRLSAVDGNGRPAVFFENKGTPNEKKFNYLYYNITCGNLDYLTPFSEISAATIYSYDAETGSYENPELEDTDEKKFKLAFPLTVKSPLAGSAWLRYILLHENATLDSSPNWENCLIGTVLAGSETSTTAYLKDLVFKLNDVITDGRYKLYTEVVLTKSDTDLPAADDKKSEQRIFYLDVLPASTVTVASAIDLDTYFDDPVAGAKTTNSFISLPLVAKTNMTDYIGPSKLELLGVLENVTTGATIFNTITCTSGVKVNWDLGNLTAGEYALNVYCFRNDFGGITIDSATELENRLNSIKTLYNCQHLFESDYIFTINQAVGEGSTCILENLLFSFTPETAYTGKQNSTDVIPDSVGKYQLRFNAPVYWNNTKFSNDSGITAQDLGAITLGSDTYAYLQRKDDNPGTSYTSLLDVLYDKTAEGFTNTGFTLEALIQSECIGNLEAQALSLICPAADANSTFDIDQGFYINYETACIHDGNTKIEYPLVNGTWQHIALVVNRDTTVTPTNLTINGTTLGIEDINVKPTLRVYVNGVLAQVKPLSEAAYTLEAGNAAPQSILMLNAASPYLGRSDYDLASGTGLLGRGTCKLGMLRGYKQALRSSQVYNNYLNAIPEANRIATIEKSAVALPKIYFVRNNLEATAEGENRSKWYAKNEKINTTFEVLHSINSKEASKKSLVNCTMYCGYPVQDGTATKINWIRYPDVDVYLQGTSSLEYPVKNYKIKVYNNTTTVTGTGESTTYTRTSNPILPPGQDSSTGWLTMDSTYTLKCDYMEHSHRNNTPTACYYQDHVLDAVITSLHSSEIADNSTELEKKAVIQNYYSPARQVVENELPKYRDAIDGFACEVYYADNTGAHSNWVSGEYKQSSNGMEQLAGSYMFNVDKEGKQLGFEPENYIVGAENKNLLCISYEGGTNNNSSAAAFVPYTQSYFEYIKNSFNMFPLNYLKISINNSMYPDYYRFDANLFGPRKASEESDTLLYDTFGESLNSTLASNLEDSGGKVSTATEAVVEILSKQAFEANEKIFSSYADYSSYVLTLISSCLPTHRKVRATDNSFLYFTDNDFGSWSEGSFITTNLYANTFAAKAQQGHFEHYSGTSPEIDNINGKIKFNASITTESDYFKATLEPRFSSKKIEKDKLYNPIKTAVDWVYRYTDDANNFKASFKDYFSLEYSLAYYLQMQVFAQVDNAGKNAMFDIWQLDNETSIFDDFNIGQTAQVLGLNRLFPRPYDMDTQMGLDNSGEDCKSPSVELNLALSPSKITGNDIAGGRDGLFGIQHPAVSSWQISTRAPTTGTRFNTYNTSESKLWKAFGKAFNTEIREAYSYLRSTGVYSVDAICRYVSEKTSDIISEKIYNKDAALKYLSYYDSSSKDYDTRYYKCIQGNRLNRYRDFLEKRLIFLDSLYEYGRSATYTTMEIRSNAIQPASVLGIQVYSPQYVKIEVDSGKQASIIAYIDPSYTYTYSGQTFPGTLFTLPTTGADKNAVISGAGNLQVCRHLEHFYLNKCNIGSATKLTEINLAGAAALKELTLGNNKYIRELDLSGTTSLASSISLSQCTNLERIDISNSAITGLTLPASQSIYYLNLAYSKIKKLILVDLPNLKSENLDITGCTSITEIKLVNCPQLTNIDFTAFPNLTSLTIENCPGITEVNLTNNKVLATLTLTDSKKTLTTLTLKDTKGPAFKNLNLASCAGLTNINLSGCGTGTLGEGKITLGAAKDDNSFSKVSLLDLSNATIPTIVTSTTTNGSSLKDIYDFSDLKFTSTATISFNSNESVKAIQNLIYTGNLKSLFYNATSLQTLTNCTLVTTSDDISNMFYRCYALTSLGTVSSWNMSMAKNVSSVFYNASKMTFANAKSFIQLLTRATNFNSFMCLAATGTDETLPEDFFENLWNPEDLQDGDPADLEINLYQAFYGTHVTEVSDKVFENIAPYVTNAESIFSSCTRLQNISPTLFKNFSKVTTLKEAFYSCTALSSGILTDKDTVSAYFTNTSLTDVSGMFFGCKNLTAYSSTIQRFFNNLPNIVSANYTFYGLKEIIKDDPTKENDPVLPFGLLKLNTKLCFIDGLFAKSGLVGALPDSIFCDCDSCKASATAEAICAHSRNTNFLSARGLFAGNDKLTGNISKNFFKAATSLRLIGAVKYYSDTSRAYKVIAEGKTPDYTNNNIAYWAPDNTITWDTNVKMSLPGMFANTAITAFHERFLQPLGAKLLDCSMLFASVTCNSSDDYWRDTELTYKPSKDGRELFTYTDDSQDYTTYLPDTLFESALNLKDLSYAFCANTTWTKIPDSLFANNSNLVDLSGTFMCCPQLETIESNGSNSNGKSGLAALISKKESLKSVAHLFAEDNILGVELTDDIFEDCSSLGNCEGMFLNNAKLTVKDYMIAPTLFNSCRNSLENTAYMFAGCHSLAAVLAPGKVIINDPVEVKASFDTYLENLIPSNEIVEAKTLLKYKDDIKAINANFKFYNDLLPEYQAAFIELYRNEVDNSWTNLGSEQQNELYKADKINYELAIKIGEAKIEVTKTKFNEWTDSDSDKALYVVKNSEERYYLDIESYIETSFEDYLKDQHDTDEEIKSFESEQADFIENIQALTELLLKYPDLSTFSEFSATKQFYNVKQIGLLGNCIKLTKVHHMFAYCDNLFGPIPPDLFYSYPNRINSKITSLESLFDCCFNLTLDEPRLRNLGNLTDISIDYPRCVTYYTTNGSTQDYSQLCQAGGGNFRLVYPTDIIYNYDEENDEYSLSLAAEPEFFIPENWISQLTAVNNIKRIFCNVGIIRNSDTDNIETINLTSVEDKMHYSKLSLESGTFSNQQKITTAEWAFGFVGTLGNTVLTNIFLSTNLSTLTNIAYMFYGSKLKGFTNSSSGYRVFEKSGKNTVLEDITSAFYLANQGTYLTLADDIKNDFSDPPVAADLEGYAPRFYSASYFTKINSDKIKGTFYGTNVQPYFNDSTVSIEDKYTEVVNINVGQLASTSIWKPSEKTWNDLFSITPSAVTV